MQRQAISIISHSSSIVILLVPVVVFLCWSEVNLLIPHIAHVTRLQPLHLEVLVHQLLRLLIQLLTQKYD